MGLSVPGESHIAVLQKLPKSSLLINEMPRLHSDDVAERVIFVSDQNRREVPHLLVLDVVDATSLRRSNSVAHTYSSV